METVPLSLLLEALALARAHHAITPLPFLAGYLDCQCPALGAALWQLAQAQHAACNVNSTATA